MRPSKFSVVRAVGKRMVPYLIEATLIPSLLFYGLLVLTSELRWAIVGALAWSYAAVGRRVVGGRAVPGLLILATLGISVRTVIYLLSNNNFNALAASTSLTLLLTLPVTAFVGIATVAAWVITFTGVVLTVRDAVRTAHGEQLVTAVGPNGTLYAYVHGCQPFEPQVVTSRPGLHITRRRHA